MAVIEVQKRSQTPHPTASLLYISRTVRARITYFYRHIQADLLYICTGYDITNYFRSEATVKRPSKTPPPTALGRILMARRIACPTNWWAACYYYCVLTFSAGVGAQRFIGLATAITNYNDTINHLLVSGSIALSLVANFAVIAALMPLCRCGCCLHL